MAWEEIDEALNLVLTLRRGLDLPPSDQVTAAEEHLFAVLRPYLERVAAVFAARRDWPSTFGDSWTEIAEELMQRCQEQLLLTLRGSGLAQGSLKKAYVWQIYRSLWSHAWRGKPPTLSIESVAEPHSLDPPLDEEVESKEWMVVPPEVSARLAAVFQAVVPPRRQAAQRRQLLVLLHCPFLAHGGKGAWGLALACGDLARLLGVGNSTITKDREALALQFGVHPPDARLEWFAATRLGTRLVLAPAVPPQLLADPLPSAAGGSRQAQVVAILWQLLRLIQVDAVSFRQRLYALQGSDPDLIAEFGAQALRVSIDLVPQWVGDRVIVHEVL